MVQDPPGWMVQDVVSLSWYRIHRSAARCPGWAVDPPDGMGGILCGRIAPDAVQGKYGRRMGGPGSVVQDQQPDPVQDEWSRMSWRAWCRCGFHIYAVAAYRVAGGVVGWVLTDKHKKSQVFRPGCLCVLWFLLDPENTSDNCHSVQDPPFQGFYAALLLRLFIMHKCSTLQP